MTEPPALHVVPAPAEEEPPALAARVGEELPGATVRLTREDLVRFAGAVTDFNPVHWDEAAARDAGLPGVVAQPALVLARVLQVVADWAGDPGRLLDYSCQFAEAVPVPRGGGVDLAVTARVGAVEDGGWSAVVDVSASVEGTRVLDRARVTVDLS